VYEQPPIRRISPALAVVLVLLAAVAGSAAFVVTRQIVGGGPANTAANGPSGSLSPGTATSAGTPGAGPTTPKVTTSTTSSGPDPAAGCPAPTEAAVKAKGLPGGLKLLLYVSAGSAGSLTGAEAWICQNSAGLLIYQGHRRTGPFTDVCCSDTILLATGIKGRVVADGATFVATSPKDVSNPDDPNHTDYHVSRTDFYYIDYPQNTRVTYTIDRVAP
jgi:hypothetical protein